MNKRLTSEEKEQENLVVENMKLVHHIVQNLKTSYNNGSYDYDDLVSIGFIGLIKASRTFDPNKKIKFSTYAGKCISNEIYMFFRTENSHNYDTYLDSPISINIDGDELKLCDILESPNSEFTKEFEKKEIFTDIINIILNLLTSRERFIMLNIIAGTTHKNIANTLNVSRYHISRLAKDLYKKILLYFNTSQPFKEFFSMSIIGDFYKISFSTKDIKHFNKIFASFLENLTSTENLPDFKVSSNEEQIIVTVPVHPDSFSFVAQFIREIDNYNMSFVSDKINTSTMKSSTAKNAHTNISLPKKTSNQSDQVRDYIKTLDYFTVKELEQHFPNIKFATINSIIFSSKKMGLITPIAKGKYKVNKKD